MVIKPVEVVSEDTGGAISTNPASTLDSRTTTDDEHGSPDEIGVINIGRLLDADDHNYIDDTGREPISIGDRVTADLEPGFQVEFNPRQPVNIGGKMDASDQSIVVGVNEVVIDLGPPMNVDDTEYAHSPSGNQVSIGPEILVEQ